MIHIHDLGGCAPAPLAHYLKALGILRLVAESKDYGDPEARGWWEGERFRLATTLDRTALEAFFLNWYEPTPLVAPWNRGSGFFAADDPGLAALESSSANRFGSLRQGIDAAKKPLHNIASADQAVRLIKEESKVTKADRLSIRRDLDISEDPKTKLLETQKKEIKRLESVLRETRRIAAQTEEYKKRLAEAERLFKRLKAELIPYLRQVWRGPHQEWLNAALVLDSEGRARWPSLLGTGGADGRLDFTNNFFQRLGEVFDLTSPSGNARPLANDWTSGTLWGTPIANCQIGSAVGQYLPGMAGGANSENSPDGDSLLNPMDLILMMEGTLIFTAHATRRLGATEQSRAAAPFAVSAQGAGYASAADSDESARGEQWMPLWGQPLALVELKRLFAEGRAQIGARPVNEPLHLARAVARLGTARGITAFQRYAYIERNGQSNLAVPIGRFRVPNQISPRIACLDDLDAWLPRLRRQAHADHAPARLKQAERRLADAIFTVVQHPGQTGRWQSVLLALAHIESIHVHGGNLRAGPTPRLRPDWILAADDGSSEFRLALCAALQAAAFKRNGEPMDRVRRHWLPVKNDEAAAVMQGRVGISDAISIAERRLIEASQRGERRLPLVAAFRAAAHPADLAAWMTGTVNTDRTLALARALMAVDAKAYATAMGRSGIGLPSPTARSNPDEAWMVLRLALLPWPLADGRRISTDPAIFRRLSSGDAATAVDIALRRLLGAGIKTTVRAATVPSSTARLWAAALAFPITRSTAEAFLQRIQLGTPKENRT
ncbi:type I-U CRISPR-associated protein Csx17 [uncultured Thiodictyon sp.]|uniref:type I-G CRISPR-associated protein Cas8g1/Csx17 n=1 Tax=uncultured Thiodictyon sp. TaxID=1846217 RepID=UPI0025FB58C6|nr:type I-U CRISPR-associated protein Csx17 [uncultured Thiodictyon sp.]